MAVAKFSRNIFCLPPRPGRFDSRKNLPKRILPKTFLSRETFAWHLFCTSIFAYDNRTSRVGGVRPGSTSRVQRRTAGPCLCLVYRRSGLSGTLLFVSAGGGFPPPRGVTAEESRSAVEPGGK